MYHCPHCHTPIIPGSAYCANCNFNFGVPQTSAIQVVTSTREKRYRNLLIILAVFFVFDGIFWRVLAELADRFGYEVYDYIDPYRWLTMIAYASVPAVVGLLLPKTTSWRLILIIGGSIWFAYRIFDYVREIMQAKDFIFFEF